MMLFAFVRFYGLAHEMGITILPQFQSAYNIHQIFLTSGIAGLLLGVLYATIEFVLNRFSPPRVSTALIILSQVILVTISVMLISISVRHIYNTLFQFRLPLNTGWWYKDVTIRPLYLYIFASSLVFTSIVVITEKFDKANLLKIFFGYYRTPKEEHRIFMFLDLKSSTTYAEKLGHLKYSQLIQDCFYDLNDVVEQYKAEIYQYIGDEAILTWDWKKGIQSNRCIEICHDKPSSRKS